MILFIEELVHHFINPQKKSPPKPEQKNGEEQQSATTADPEVVNESPTKEAEKAKSLMRTFFVVASMSFHSIIAGLTLGLEKDVAGVWINYAAIALHKHVIDFLIGVELVTSKVRFLYPYPVGHC